MTTIKKIILLALSALMMVGCEKSSNKTKQEKIDEMFAERTFVVDSCEYISFWKSSTHKGNCRFCKERRQKELEELVIKLKEK
jgi:hypothetical protein